MASDTSHEQPTRDDASSQSRSFDRITKGKLCAGCGGCAGVFSDKVEMHSIKPGFLRPRQIKPLSEAEDALGAVA